MDVWLEIPVTMLAALSVLGVLYKFVVLPQIQRDLIVPMQETHRQVTENGGKNEPPTLPDKLHLVSAKVDALQASVDDLAKSDEQLAEADARMADEQSRAAEHRGVMQASLSALVLVMDEHLRWSRRYVDAQEAGDTPPPFYDPEQED